MSSNLFDTGLKPCALGDWAFSPKTETTAPHFQMHPNHVFRYPGDFNLVMSSTGFVEEPFFLQAVFEV